MDLSRERWDSPGAARRSGRGCATWEHSRSCVASERTEGSLSRPAVFSDVCVARIAELPGGRAGGQRGRTTISPAMLVTAGHFGCRGSQMGCAVAEGGMMISERVDDMSVDEILPCPESSRRSCWTGAQSGSDRRG
jgi:hypothetical protein